MLLEKFRFTNLVKKFPNFMEFEISLPYKQNPATGPYYNPVQSRHLSIFLSSMTRFLKYSLSFKSHQGNLKFSLTSSIKKR
jgi:hypothetical protein